MASTFSTNLRVELMADGEQEDLWGQKTNTNLQLVEDAISERTSVVTTGGNSTLTTNNGSADEARNLLIDVSGTLTSDATIIAPDVNKLYFIRNGTSGGFSVYIKNTSDAGAGLEVTQGSIVAVYIDATNDTQFALTNESTTISAFARTYLDDTTSTATLATLLAAGTALANTFTADQTIQSTVADATAGPSLTLWRNSASPAADDELGQLLFDGEDAGGNQTTYGSVKARIVDATGGSEDGAVDVDTIVAGTGTRAARFQQGLLLGTAIGNDKGAGSINATAYFGNGAFLFPGARFGVQISNNGTDADHDIDIAAGCVANSTATELIPVSAVTIQIDNASDRVDSSTLDADTYYHILVGRDGTNLVAGFSKVDSLPSGWDTYRRIWSIRTDSSSNVPGFTTIENYMILDDPLLVVNEAVGTTAELHQIGPGARTRARVTIQSSGNGVAYVTTPDQTDTAVSQLSGVASHGLQAADAGAGVEFNRWAHTFDVITDTSGQARFRQSASTTLRVNLLGWQELAF